MRSDWLHFSCEIIRREKVEIISTFMRSEIFRSKIMSEFFQPIKMREIYSLRIRLVEIHLKTNIMFGPIPV